MFKNIAKWFGNGSVVTALTTDPDMVLPTEDNKPRHGSSTLVNGIHVCDTCKGNRWATKKKGKIYRCRQCNTLVAL